MDSSSDPEKKIYERYFSLISDEKLCKIKDVSLSELGYLAQHIDNFLSFHSTSVNTQNLLIPKVAELIVSFGIVKTFVCAEDRDYDSKDFPYEAENAEKCFNYLNSLLPYYENINISSRRKFLVQVLILCATHNSNYLWSNEKCVTLCQNFIKDLLTFSKHKNLTALLSDDTFHPTIFKGILRWMRPSLMKDTWMKNPSSCYIFHWVLCHAKHPHLVDYLSDILPPSFMFSSYYSIPQQVIGIKCFDHILNNVPPSIIKTNGVEDAIFDVLKVYMHSKEVPVIEALYPCLLKLPMMDVQRVNRMPWLQFDVVLQQLLENIDMESNPELRYLFLTQAHLFIKVMPCFKHLKKTLDLIYKNLTANSVHEERCRVISLKILKDLIKSCWPRMENHCFDIILTVLKVFSDFEYPSYTMEDEVSGEVLKLSEECLHLLKYSCPKTFMNLVDEYLENEDSLPGSSQLKYIIQNPN